MEDEKMMLIKSDNADDITKNPRICDDMLYMILSRLPVKSLMRFKCVRKSWQSLIQSDPHFISLHFEQSKTRLLMSSTHVVRRKQGTPFTISTNDEEERETNFFLADHLFQEGTDTIKAGGILMTMTPWTRCMSMLAPPINGLICFIKDNEKTLLIYNLSTREATPWIETPIRTEQPTKWYGFGFDHITKEHKVICVCQHGILNCKRDPRNQTCEVLTVGQNSWRRIHEVPPYFVSGVSFYSNGALYWVVNMGTDYYAWDEIIVVFDVGNEKFRVIEIPKFIPKTNFGPSLEYFIEVDGCIALLDRAIHDVNNVRMLIFDDHDSNKSTSTRSYWIEEPISMACDPEEERLYGFKAIAGTDLIIVRSSASTLMECLVPSIYFYDRKKKTSRKVGIETITHSGGIPVIKQPNYPPWEFEYYFKIDTFVESLFPVRNQQQQHHHPLGLLSLRS